MESDIKISCVIPAYNEEKEIGNVLKALMNAGRVISEIIVVDDSSTDNTKKIVAAFPAVRLLTNDQNMGKSATVARGIKNSAGSHILMLDADLLFLNEKNITDLIAPIVKDKADVTISYRKNAWPLFPFKDIDYLSGERIFPKKYVAPLIHEIAHLPGYGLEVFLNREVIIKNQLRISVVQWPNVENNFQRNKRGFLRGVKVVIKIWWHVLCTVSVIEMYAQNISMRKLIIK